MNLGYSGAIITESYRYTKGFFGHPPADRIIIITNLHLFLTYKKNHYENGLL